MLRTLPLLLLSFLAVSPAFAVNLRSEAVIIGGAGADPGGVWVELSDLVDRVAADHQISASQRDEFKSRIFLSYAQQRRELHGVVDTQFSGRVRLPTCVSDRTYAFQLESRQEGVNAYQTGSLGEVLGEQLELGLVEFATSCPTH